MHAFVSFGIVSTIVFLVLLPRIVEVCSSEPVIEEELPDLR